MKPLTLIPALALLMAACSGDAKPVAGPPGSSSPAKPPVVGLLIYNLTLTQSAASPVVVGVGAASRTATVIVNHAGKSVIDVYALSRINEPLPAAGCPAPIGGGSRPRHCLVNIGSGVRDTVEAQKNIAAIALVLRSGPPEVTIRIEYEERSRSVSLRLPLLAVEPGASVCKDNGCNPFIEITPLRSGTLTAKATFLSGVGHLQLQQGRVIARSFTATGIPYKIPDESSGGSPLRISARIDTPAEYALAFFNRDPSKPVEGLLIEATWP